MRDPRPLVGLSGEELEEHPAAVPAIEQARQATVWVSRLTGIVGGLFLAVALGLWLFHPGHYRLLLALLTVAMFAAILHAYAYENGQPPE